MAVSVHRVLICVYNNMQLPEIAEPPQRTRPGVFVAFPAGETGRDMLFT